MSQEEIYQKLIQKRIDLECKIEQQGFHRDSYDLSRLAKLNAKIKKLEDQMYSADRSAHQQHELPSEYAAHVTKIFS